MQLGMQMQVGVSPHSPLSRRASSRLLSRIESSDYFRLPYLPLLSLSLLSPAINVWFIYSRLHPTAPKSPSPGVTQQQSRAACKDNFQLERTICYSSCILNEGRFLPLPFPPNLCCHSALIFHPGRKSSHRTCGEAKGGSRELLCGTLGWFPVTLILSKCVSFGDGFLALMEKSWGSIE